MMRAGLVHPGEGKAEDRILVAVCWESVGEEEPVSLGGAR